MPVVMGLGALVGGIQGTMHLFGARIDTFKKEDDEFARKETIRRTTRLPIEQTISEVGEGRGAFSDYMLLHRRDIEEMGLSPGWDTSC